VTNPREATTDEVGVRLHDDPVLHVDRRLDETVADVEADVAGVRNGPVTARYEHQIARRNVGVRGNGCALIDLVAGVVQQRHAGLGPGHHGEPRAVEGIGANAAPEVGLAELREGVGDRDRFLGRGIVGNGVVGWQSFVDNGRTRQRRRGRRPAIRIRSRRSSGGRSRRIGHGLDAVAREHAGCDLRRTANAARQNDESE